ncbi:hypothetical protein FRC07_004488, partial [Ceratobasidium sp. 392]
MNAKLKELKPVDKASYDQNRECTPGTRIDVINELASWAENMDPGPRLAWLHGPAGFGKSSIATSLCLRLDGALASSVFCKRDSPELRDPRRVLTTVLYGLAMRWKAYKHIVVAAIDEDPELCLRHLQRMCDVLVTKPLQRLALAQAKQPAGSLVVVVDALDECGDATERRQLLGCLRSISQIGPWLRIVVTSRPDPDIQNFFKNVPSDWFAKYDVRQYDASADIQLFVEQRLSDMQCDDGWPKDAVDQISRRAGGLFVWARTACEFIETGYDRLERLQQALAGPRLADIDSLYTTVIETSFPSATEDNVDYMRLCLGAVVVTATRTPLSISSLASLLEDRVSQAGLKRVVDSLSSVLHVDQELGGAVRVFHPSFLDYITDRSRSKQLC